MNYKDKKHEPQRHKVTKEHKEKLFDGVVMDVYSSPLPNNTRELRALRLFVPFAFSSLCLSVFASLWLIFIFLSFPAFLFSSFPFVVISIRLAFVVILFRFLRSSLW